MAVTQPTPYCMLMVAALAKPIAKTKWQHWIASTSWVILGLIALPASPSTPPHRIDQSVKTRPTQPAREALPPNRVAQQFSKLQAWAERSGAQLSGLVMDLETQRELGKSAAHTALNPASNQKVLTAAAALLHLGPEYRFQVGLYGRNANNHVANVVLRSNGDPSLTLTVLDELVDWIKQLGVSSVGQIQVDQSAFDLNFTPPAFEQQPLEWAAFRAPVSAVALERNTVTVHVTPGTAGGNAKVWFQPEGYVSLSGTVATRRAENKQDVKLELSATGDTLHAEVAGTIGEKCREYRWARRIENPKLFAGLALKSTFLRKGITVSGPVLLGGENEQAELIAHQSAPLSELLPELGKNSDNFYAEMLLKAVGAKVKGYPGTSQKGSDVVLAELKQLGVSVSGVRITNGSGLFDANRVSAHALVKTLAAMYNNATLGPVFVEQLATGGTDGTLRKRFIKLGRRVRAKTGTLDSVVALSGYIFGRSGRKPVVFSLITNGVEGHQADARQHIDAVVEAVAFDLSQEKTKTPRVAQSTQ